MVKKVSLESANGYRALKSAIQKRRLARAIEYLCIKFSIEVEATGESVIVSLARHASLRSMTKFVKELYDLSSDQGSRFDKKLRSAIRNCTSGVPPKSIAFKFVVPGNKPIQKEKLLAKVVELNEQKVDKSEYILNIKLEDQQGKIFNLRTDIQDKMCQILKYAAARCNASAGDLRLMYEDEFCDADDTPEELGIPNGATIRVYNLNNDLDKYLIARRTLDPQVEIFFRDSKTDEPIPVLVDVFLPIKEALEIYASLYNLRSLDYVEFIHKGLPMIPELTAIEHEVLSGDFIDVVWHSDVVAVSIRALDDQIHEYYLLPSESLETTIEQFAMDCDKDMRNVKLMWDNRVINPSDSLDTLKYTEQDCITEVE